MRRRARRRRVPPTTHRPWIPALTPAETAYHNLIMDTWVELWHPDLRNHIRRTVTPPIDHPRLDLAVRWWIAKGRLPGGVR